MVRTYNANVMISVVFTAVFIAGCQSGPRFDAPIGKTGYCTNERGQNLTSSQCNEKMFNERQPKTRAKTDSEKMADNINQSIQRTSEK